MQTVGHACITMTPANEWPMTNRWMLYCIRDIACKATSSAVKRRRSIEANPCESRPFKLYFIRKACISEVRYDTQ